MFDKVRGGYVAVDRYKIATGFLASTFLLLTADLCFAMTYKCKDSSGRVIYSDSMCEYGAATVKLHDNTINRTESERSRDNQAIFDGKVNDAKSTKKYGAQCTFTYREGSGKGYVLASAAKDECYRNEILKKSGRGDQIKLDAYNLWKDYRALLKQTKQTTHCTPDYAGGMYCN